MISQDKFHQAASELVGELWRVLPSFESEEAGFGWTNLLAPALEGFILISEVDGVVGYEYVKRAWQASEQILIICQPEPMPLSLAIHARYLIVWWLLKLGSKDFGLVWANRGWYDALRKAAEQVEHCNN